MSYIYIYDPNSIKQVILKYPDYNMKKCQHIHILSNIIIIIKYLKPI